MGRGIGQHLANLRRKGAKNGLGKDPERAAERAQQLTAIDLDWNCPWPLDWQRHYRVLADLVDADGHLPDIAPGVLMDGDDIGTWLQRQKQPGTWARLLPEQQERLSAAGRRPGRRQQPSNEVFRPSPSTSRGRKLSRPWRDARVLGHITPAPYPRSSPKLSPHRRPPGNR